MKNILIVTGGAGFVGSNLIEFLIKKTKLTTGLKCAPDIDEKLFIKTNNIAPVAIVFPSKETAWFPWDKFSAIIPDPITTAVKKNVPTNSDMWEELIFIIMIFILLACTFKYF